MYSLLFCLFFYCPYCAAKKLLGKFFVQVDSRYMLPFGISLYPWAQIHCNLSWNSTFASCFHFIWRMCSSMQLSWCSLWGTYLWDWFLLCYLCMIRSVLISHKPEVLCFLSSLCLLSNLCFLCLEQWWSLCSINFGIWSWVSPVLSWLSNLRNKLALWFLAC